MCKRICTRSEMRMNIRDFMDIQKMQKVTDEFSMQPDLLHCN